MQTSCPVSGGRGARGWDVGRRGEGGREVGALYFGSSIISTEISYLALGLAFSSVCSGVTLLDSFTPVMLCQLDGTQIQVSTTLFGGLEFSSDPAGGAGLRPLGEGLTGISGHLVCKHSFAVRDASC